MLASQISSSPFLLPTQDFKVPVCVGDMSSYRYQVSIHMITEEVVSFLDANPEIPGVILMDAHKFHGAVPRSRIFERLGRRYGVELFLRKPIIELGKSIGIQTSTVMSNARIHDAVSIALHRPSSNVYDPLIIDHGGNDYRLLDVYVLLTAQSQSLQNVNDLMGSLARVEQTVESGSPLERTLDFSLTSLQKVVPFHRVAIHILDIPSKHLLGRHATLHPLNGRLAHNKMFQTILNIRQPLHVEDVNLVPAWEKVELFGEVHSWMGAPLFNSSEPLGVLSLVRHSRSPFNRNEINITSAFTNLMSRAFYKSMALSLQSV